MSPLIAILCGLGLAFVAFSLLWVYQKRTGDSGIVDVAWGTSVGLLAIFFCFISSDGNLTRRIVVGALAMTWALRLSWHVFVRGLRLPEDGRYAEMKERWGAQADWRMYRFFQFQALASVLFALPMLLVARNPAEFGWLDICGILLWGIAIGGESIADHQLQSFREKPENKGMVCRDGLWKYSRHPNYFFEWLHWWSYVLLAISYPMGWLSVIAPMAMLFFILKVTGIPPTEEQALKSRGDRYREYQRTTSAFFPWFPKNESAAAKLESTQP